MTKTDILVSKDQEIKRLNDEIVNLKEKINNLNISIGSKDEVLKSTVRELERELELAKDQQKVIITDSGPKSTSKFTCEYCGYDTSVQKSICPACSRRDTFRRIRTSTNVIYKNLDTELAEIRKSIEKQTKKNIADLENTQLDLEIKIETLENEIKRLNKRHNNEVDDLQTKNLDRINKYKEEIDELKQEIVKVKKNKTEEELEAKRKEEVEKLKAANEKLISKVAELEKVNIWKRIFNALFGIEKAARKEAIKEVIEANELQRKIEDTKQHLWSKRKGSGYEYKDYSNQWTYIPSCTVSASTW